MRRLFLVMALMIILAGCAGQDVAKCMESVETAFPGGRIAIVSSDGFKFVVKDSAGSVWYVETMNNTNTDITTKRLLFR